MAEVVIKSLAKSYPTRKGGSLVTAVDDVSLSVADGEFMVLVGPSGCGKSTTLRLIAGLEQESAGSITIDGRNVNGIPPKDRDIAMVFQNYALYPHMTVAENLGFGLKLRKTPAAEISERVRGAAALLGLENLLDRRPKELSGGQRQRVALGRAIVRQPKVFLFDEPLSNLDAQMRVSMRAEISRLHARLGATMIYVTHDQVEAMTMGDRICVMNGGKVMQTADPMTLYNRPANRFVAGFIGTPAMNLFDGVVESDGGHFQFREHNDKGSPLVVPLAAAALDGELTPGRPVTLGIRPESIHIPERRSALARDDRPQAGSYTGTVELSEPMGAETYLYLTTGKNGFVARVSPDLRCAPGDRVEVAFDIARAHLFDAEAGHRL